MKTLVESLGRAPFALCAIAIAAALCLAATHEPRKERADRNVTVVTIVKFGSGAEHMVEAADLFDHGAPYCNAGPETTYVTRVVHRL